jgi:TolB protein
MKRITAAALGVVLATGVVACTDKEPSGPDEARPNSPTGTGIIVITSVTTATDSVDLDPDGYGVSIDDKTAQPIGLNGTFTIAGQAEGMHSVTLSDVSAPCTVADGVARLITVIADKTTTVAFKVTCDPIPPPTGRLVFVSERDGNSEIYAINVDGTGLTRLTDNDVTDDDPAWSPDGKKIVFARYPESPNLIYADIYIMDADGSNEKRVTTSRQNHYPAWSPDGNKIAFSAVSDEQLGTLGDLGIYVMTLDDLTYRKNVGHRRGVQTYPVWTRDGGRIAFTSDWRAFDFVYDLYVVNADGSGITALFSTSSITNPIFFHQAEWSPDGGKIAVVTCGWALDYCYPNSTVSIANGDGSDLRTLVHTAGFASPTWSPDGNFIAFSSKQCRQCVGSLHYVRADGTLSGLISSNGYNPSWRP